MDYLVYVDGLCKRNGSSDAEAGGSFAVYRLEKGEKVDDSLHARLARRMPLYHDSEFAVVVSEQEQATNNYAEAVSLQTAIAWLHIRRSARSGKHDPHMHGQPACSEPDRWHVQNEENTPQKDLHVDI